MVIATFVIFTSLYNFILKVIFIELVVVLLSMLSMEQEISFFKFSLLCYWPNREFLFLTHLKK